MCQLFETIKVIDNELFNIEYHNQRVNQALHDFFSVTDQWDLKEMINIPKLEPGVIFRCRIVYIHQLQSVQFTPYTRKQLQCLKLVENNSINYRYKYLDREEFETIQQKYPDFDDIIIIQNNRITDCTFANLVFYDGSHWITPAHPLLKGTKRQKYIDEKIIFEKEILVDDLRSFSKCRIINAMIDLHECPDIQIENIFR